MISLIATTRRRHSNGPTRKFTIKKLLKRWGLLPHAESSESVYSETNRNHLELRKSKMSDGSEFSRIELISRNTDGRFIVSEENNDLDDDAGLRCVCEPEEVSNTQSQYRLSQHRLELREQAQTEELSRYLTHGLMPGYLHHQPGSNKRPSSGLRGFDRASPPPVWTGDGQVDVNIAQSEHWPSRPPSKHSSIGNKYIAGNINPHRNPELLPQNAGHPQFEISVNQPTDMARGQTILTTSVLSTDPTMHIDDLRCDQLSLSSNQAAPSISTDNSSMNLEIEYSTLLARIKVDENDVEDLEEKWSPVIGHHDVYPIDLSQAHSLNQSGASQTCSKQHGTPTSLGTASSTTKTTDQPQQIDTVQLRRPSLVQQRKRFGHKRSCSEGYGLVPSGCILPTYNSTPKIHSWYGTGMSVSYPLQDDMELNLYGGKDNPTSSGIRTADPNCNGVGRNSGYPSPVGLPLNQSGEYQEESVVRGWLNAKGSLPDMAADGPVDLDASEAGMLDARRLEANSPTDQQVSGASSNKTPTMLPQGLAQQPSSGRQMGLEQERCVAPPPPRNRDEQIEYLRREYLAFQRQRQLSSLAYLDLPYRVDSEML